MAITFDPNDPDVAQLRGLERQRAMAAALTSKAFADKGGGQMAGRVYIPNYGIGSAVSDLANMYFGNKLAKETDAAELDLATARRQRSADILRQSGEAEAGREAIAATPDQPGPSGLTITRDDEGNLVSGATAGRAAQAAVAPNRAMAAQLLFGSSDPRLQALGAERMKDVKLAPGEKIFNSMGQATLSNAPKLEGMLGTAAGLLGLPPDSGTWNKQQQDAANAKVLELKKASAPNTNVSVDASTGKSLAGQVGDIVKTSQEKTFAAVKSADAADQILGAIPKAYTGAAGNIKLNANQIASMLGIPAGKEQLAATRVAVQSLAKLTLQGRKEMKGEGQITESESLLAERANSGDITLTPTELTVLANAAKRASGYQQQVHQGLLDTMGKDKQTAGLVPYYTVPGMGPIPTPAAQGGIGAAPAGGGGPKTGVQLSPAAQQFMNK